VRVSHVSTTNGAESPGHSFPTLDRECWLNHAAISPWPTVVIEAMQRFVADNASRGPAGYRQWLEIESELRDRLARLLGGVDPASIALVENTSAGLNLVAAGLDWRPRDRVVIPAGEFPSNRLPWLALEPRGVELLEVVLPTADPEAALISALDRRTRLLSVSAVRYDTGLRLDLSRLADACRRNGTLLCVDAIQQVGALPLEAERLGIDFLACGAHKWLMCPEGIGFFWARGGAMDALDVIRHGWRMCPHPFNFDKRDWQPVSDARRFEIGTLNTAGQHALHAAVGLLLEIGMPAIGRALLERTDWLHRELSRLDGVEVATPSAASRRAGILSFRHRRHSATALHSELLGKDIHTAVRGPLLRLSPHFYTPQAMLEEVVAHIRAVG
jgi:cysteine desulfurase / selenocysteine lyase